MTTTNGHGPLTTDDGLISYPLDIGAHRAQLFFNLFVAAIDVIDAIYNCLPSRGQPCKDQRS